jgi:hypothetical protein
MGLAPVHTSWAIVTTEIPSLVHPNAVALAPSPRQIAYGLLS